MEILKDNNEVYYECDRCGSVFKTNLTEHKRFFSIYYCNCPVCSRILTIDNRMGEDEVKIFKLKASQHFDRRI